MSTDTPKVVTKVVIFSERAKLNLLKNEMAISILKWP